jgi:rhodanese-related sulfurtransferase
MLFLATAAVWAADESPLSVAGATTIDTAQAKALFEKRAVFVDLRKEFEYDAGRIPGAYNMFINTAFKQDALAAKVKKDDPVVFYCNGPKCPHSAKASEMALSWGYTKVSYYRDGLPGWKAAGNPVE